MKHNQTKQLRKTEQATPQRHPTFLEQNVTQ